MLQGSSGKHFPKLYQKLVVQLGSSTIQQIVTPKLAALTTNLKYDLMIPHLVVNQPLTDQVTNGKHTLCSWQIENVYIIYKSMDEICQHHHYHHHHQNQPVAEPKKKFFKVDLVIVVLVGLKRFETGPFKTGNQTEPLLRKNKM